LEIKSARFVISAQGPKQYPGDGLPQIAVAGRSNVGKSSLLNMLMGRKRLAKTSRTPGKTRLINFFLVNEGGPGAFYLVDIPGFGYARAAGKEKRSMEAAIERFLRESPNLAGLVYLVDIRVTDSRVDSEAVAWLSELDHPLLVVATKADKLGTEKARKAREEIAKRLRLPEPPLATSSLRGGGRDELMEQLGILLRSA
jgi:GTP-binding protein